MVSAGGRRTAAAPRGRARRPGAGPPGAGGRGLTGGSRRGVAWTFAGVAFVLAAARALRVAVPSDAGFHLLGAGNRLLSGSLLPYAIPPGGEHAPLFGAFSTAFLGLSGGGEGTAALRGAGAILLGLAAALPARFLALRHGSLAVLPAVALLTLPAAAAASFPLRPDAAVAGVLLTLAMMNALSGDRGLGVTAPASLAALSSPWAMLPAAVLVGLRLRSRVAWIAPAGAAGLVLALSLALPSGQRPEILRGLLSGVQFPGSFPGVGDALLRVWGAGVLFVLPPLLPLFSRRFRLPPDVHVAWIAALLGSLLAGAPGEFRATAALPLALTALLGAHLLGRSTDEAPAGSQRLVLAAALLPALLLFASAGADRREREQARAAILRDAAVAEFLRQDPQTAGRVVAARAGPYRSLGPDGAQRLVPRLTQPLPRTIVLTRGRLPAGSEESRLFSDPFFLARYVPLEFRHADESFAADVIWRLVDDFGNSSADYARDLRAAWEAEDAGDDDAAREHYREARAREPGSRARASEGLGLLYERAGDAGQAETYFELARRADPFAVRARGHLIDRALARGGILRADTLITEALEANPHLAELAGTRARLFSAAGLPREAVLEGERAVRLNPSGRIVANWGIFLWRDGKFDLARQVWARAVRTDPELVKYLGDFRRAEEGAPGPPTLPLFTDAEFSPDPSPIPRPEIRAPDEE